MSLLSLHIPEAPIVPPGAGANPNSSRATDLAVASPSSPAHCAPPRATLASVIYQNHWVLTLSKAFAPAVRLPGCHLHPSSDATTQGGCPDHPL